MKYNYGTSARKNSQDSLVQQNNIIKLPAINNMDAKTLTNYIKSVTENKRLMSMISGYASGTLSIAPSVLLLAVAITCPAIPFASIPFVIYAITGISGIYIGSENIHQANVSRRKMKNSIKK